MTKNETEDSGQNRSTTSTCSNRCYLHKDGFTVTTNLSRSEFNMDIHPKPSTSRNQSDLVETDAAPINYRKVMKEVDNELVKRDVESLKFLCHDVIPVAKLEKITRGLQLLELLERKNKIGENDICFLLELLYRIGRLDLLRKLGYESDVLRPYLQRGESGLSSYRILLHQISEQMVAEDVETAKFLCGNRGISRTKLESIKTPQDLFLVLEQAQLISQNNLNFLRDIFSVIERDDLLREVNEYHTGATIKETSSPTLPGVDYTDFRFHVAPAHHVYDPVFSNFPNLRERFRTMELPGGYSDSWNKEGYHVELPLDPIVVEKPHSPKTCDSNGIISSRGNEDTGLVGRGDDSPLQSTGVQTSLRPEQSIRRSSSRRDRQVTFNSDIGASAEVDPHLHQLKQEFPTYFENFLQLSNTRPDLQPEIILQGQIPFANSRGGSGVYSSTVRERPRSGHRELRSRDVSEVTRAAVGHSREIAVDEDELPCYPMDKRPRGLCLIINNKIFRKEKNDPQSRSMPDREGTDIDCKQMEAIFRRLHFQVHIYSDLTDTEITRTLADFAVNKDHTNYNCFVCCILTHGAEGKLYGTNGKLVAIKDLLNFFKGVSAPTLRGKPKIFFIQACQGKEKQPAVDLVEEDSATGPDRTVDRETIPNEADFLLGYASLPGFVSYRSKNNGSWYITTLYHMLDRYAHRYDLLSILIKVNEEVGRATAFNEHKQSPAPLATLRKKVFFR